MNKIAAIYTQDPLKLERILQELKASAFENISILVKPDSDKEVRAYSTAAYSSAQHTVREVISDAENVNKRNPKALLQDSAIGTVIGAAAGAGALLIPGVGPILAAGPLSAALTSVTAGSAVGLSLGALVGVIQDQGLPRHRVGIYRHAFNQGKMIVLLELDSDAGADKVAEARRILDRHHPETLDSF